MILVFVWDGLRPDLISDELTPYLHAQARQGVFCRHSHAVFPSATRINSAALSTGCYPGRHGIVDNELYVPAIDPSAPVSCANWTQLQRMADLEGGRLLTVPTLAETLRRHGRRMVAAGSGSPGTTYLLDPTGVGPVFNWAVSWPGTLLERCGGPLPAASSSDERNALVLNTLRDVLIPEHTPDVAVVWITEPDHAQHEHGLGAPESRAALRAVDQAVGALAAEIAAGPYGADLSCLVLSDHGFATVGQTVDVAAALVAAGLKESPASTDVVLAGQSIYLAPEARERLPRVAAFLQAQPWMGALFVRDDLAAACPGAMAQSAARVYHRRSAEIIYSFAWDHAPNVHGVPGAVCDGSDMAATHGAAAPYTLHNTLVAWGPAFKAETESAVPCGIVDIAPTLLHLLGITPPPGMDGRILREILREGPHPASVAVRGEIRRAPAAADGRTQSAAYSHADGHGYLDYAAIVSD